MNTINTALSSESPLDITCYIAQKKSATDLKKSFSINIANIKNKKTENFRPAAPCVWSVGYNGGYVSLGASGAGTNVAAAGAIELNNESIYELTIVDKSNKQLGSERQVFKRYNYTSSAAATQLEIATYFVNIINADFDRKVHNVQAKLVSSAAYAAASGSTPEIFGDNTSGTDYGIELYSLPSTTFVDQYTVEIPNFEVQVNSELGFGATEVVKIQGGSAGVGTLVQAAKFEKFANGFEGQTNYRAWPVIEPASLVLSALDSVTITPVGTVVAGALDAVEFETSNVDTDVYGLTNGTDIDTNILHPGATITFNGGSEQTVLYFRAKDVAILTASETAAADKAVTKGTGYVVYSFETSDEVVGSGSRHTYTLPKRIIIFARQEGSANLISSESANISTVFGLTAATLEIA